MLKMKLMVIWIEMSCKNCWIGSIVLR